MLVSVADAEKIVLQHARSWGTEYIAFNECLGRVLAENIVANRDIPPYDRVTMDGIAIHYAAFAEGRRVFPIKGTMAAGDAPIDIDTADQCVELMTGCVLPSSTDTVIRYEDVVISNGNATVLNNELRQGTNIHRAGSDKSKGAVVARKGTFIDATIISIAAAVGQVVLAVQKLPRVVIISTGNELVPVQQTPESHQVRVSNSHAISALLQPYSIKPQLLHVNDDEGETIKHIQECLETYDAVIISGGVSMGKFDHVPQALHTLGVTRHFHKVKQRPGKPFWFGSDAQRQAVVFAFPGNPVSAFMCTVRYFLPWLEASILAPSHTPTLAMLATDITFMPDLRYFLQVHVSIGNDGRLIAKPLTGNGSGDFANLTEANAFMELPEEINEFKQGDVYRIWPFKKIL